MSPAWPIQVLTVWGDADNTAQQGRAASAYRKHQVPPPRTEPVQLLRQVQTLTDSMRRRLWNALCHEHPHSLCLSPDHWVIHHTVYDKNPLTMFLWEISCLILSVTYSWWKDEDSLWVPDSGHQVPSRLSCPPTGSRPSEDLSVSIFWEKQNL